MLPLAHIRTILAPNQQLSFLEGYDTLVNLLSEKGVAKVRIVNLHNEQWSQDVDLQILRAVMQIAGIVQQAN